MTESAKLFRRAEQLERDLATLDAQIEQIEAQAQAALAAGDDPDALIAKAVALRAKARATVAALKTTERAAADTDWEEGRAEARAAEAAVRNAAKPLEKTLRDAFAELADKAGRSPHLGELVRALNDARESTLAAFESAIDVPAIAAFNSKWREQKTVPTRDARGRRAKLDHYGQIVDPVTGHPVEDISY